LLCALARQRSAVRQLFPQHCLSRKVVCAEPGQQYHFSSQAPAAKSRPLCVHSSSQLITFHPGHAERTISRRRLEPRQRSKLMRFQAVTDAFVRSRRDHSLETRVVVRRATNGVTAIVGQTACLPQDVAAKDFAAPGNHMRGRRSRPSRWQDLPGKRLGEQRQTHLGGRPHAPNMSGLGGLTRLRQTPRKPF